MINKYLIPAAFFLASLTSSSALTPAEITPATLAGKTFTFTIVNGGSPYATTGTWSGSFSASGTAFTAANVTGDFVNISTTCTLSENSGFTDVSLAKFVEGQGPATLTLYIDNGIGKYEASISGINGVSLNGTFTIGAIAPKAAEIDIQQPVGISLTDASSKTSFGSVKVGKAGTTKTFLIKNTGTKKLSGLAISKSGKHASDFIITPLKSKNIAEGNGAKFKVTFKPKTKGIKNAILSIKSSDKDESPFTIKITGAGAP